MAAQELRTAAVAAKYQLLQPSRHVQLSCRLLNSSVVKLLSASSEARATAVEEEWSRFSLLSLSLSLLRTFLQQQGLATAVAYPCAFSQSVFTLGLSSSHQSNPTSGPHWAIGGIVVFLWVFLGFLGPSQSAGCHFFLLCRHFCGMFTCSSSGGRTATATGLPCAAVRRRSPLLPHLRLQLRSSCHHVSSFANASPLALRNTH